jgi:teichuronic acid biosynthesis glycosyltransferase TuaG
MISIIIPAYNSASTIVEALESVVAQTFVDYEVIIVDDCSRDNTVKVVEEWLLMKRCCSIEGNNRSQSDESRYHDETWRVLRQSVNAGPAVARNAGIANAKGEWIAFLDADDLWLSRHLEILMTVAQQAHAVMTCGDVIRIGGSEDNSRLCSMIADGEEKCRIAVSAQTSLLNCCRSVPLMDFARYNPISTTAVLLQKKLFSDVGGFDVTLCGPEDYDLWMRVAHEGKICYIEIPVSLYRHRSGGLSSDDRKFLPQVIRVLNKAFGPGGALEAFQKSKVDAFITQYWSGALMALSRGARRTAMGLLWKAWRLQLPSGCSRKRPWVKMLIRCLVG